MSDWLDVAPEEEFGIGQARLVHADGLDIAVFNLNGNYYALEDRCTHEDAPLLGCGLPVEDLMEGDQIICPRHGAHFCIRTGAALTPPAYEDMTCFPVRVENGMVQTRDDRWD